MRQADKHTSRNTSRAAFADKNLGRLIMRCYVLVICALKCQLNDYLKAQMRDNFYHANSVTGGTGCSEGNNLLDNRFGILLKRSVQRPENSSVLGQFQDFSDISCVSQKAAVVNYMD